MLIPFIDCKLNKRSPRLGMQLLCVHTLTANSIPFFLYIDEEMCLIWNQFLKTMHYIKQNNETQLHSSALPFVFPSLHASWQRTTEFPLHARITFRVGILYSLYEKRRRYNQKYIYIVVKISNRHKRPCKANRNFRENRIWNLDHFQTARIVYYHLN